MKVDEYHDPVLEVLVDDFMFQQLLKAAKRVANAAVYDGIHAVVSHRAMSNLTCTLDRIAKRKKR